MFVFGFLVFLLFLCLYFLRSISVACLKLVIWVGTTMVDALSMTVCLNFIPRRCVCVLVSILGFVMRLGWLFLRYVDFSPCG